MFIQTEDTPNPDTMKFLPSRAVVSNSVEFKNKDEAKESLLAMSLFNVSGVKSVFFGNDFISITRDKEVNWEELRPLILSVIMDHFVNDRPVMQNIDDNNVGTCGSPCSCSVASDCSSDKGCGQEEIVQQICELLDKRIRPAVAQDGGDVAFEKYEDGIVYLRLKGACAGCPSATATLKFGIENMLKHFIPEVKEVRRVG